MLQVSDERVGGAGRLAAPQADGPLLSELDAAALVVGLRVRVRGHKLANIATVTAFDGDKAVCEYGTSKRKAIKLSKLEVATTD